MFTEEERFHLNAELRHILVALECMEHFAHGNAFLDDLWNAYEFARAEINQTGE